MNAKRIIAAVGAAALGMGAVLLSATGASAAGAQESVDGWTYQDESGTTNLVLPHAFQGDAVDLTLDYSQYGSTETTWDHLAGTVANMHRLSYDPATNRMHGTVRTTATLGLHAAAGRDGAAVWMRVDKHNTATVSSVSAAGEAVVTIDGSGWTSFEFTDEEGEPVGTALNKGMAGTVEASLHGLKPGVNRLTVVAWALPLLEDDINNEAYPYETFELIVEIPGSWVEMTAEAVSVDHEAKTVDVAGTGQPGAEIRVTDPSEADHVTHVRPDGTWAITVPGLVVGENKLVFSQYVDGEQAGPTVDIDVILEDVPVVDPGVAAGALAVVLAGAGLYTVRRRSVDAG